MTVRYVNGTSGSNAGAGGIGAPWQTFAYAMANASVGDTVLFRVGTYTLNGVWVYGRDSIIIQNYPGEAVIWEGPSSVGGASRLVGWQNCRDVLVQNNPAGGSFTIRHSGGTIGPTTSGTMTGGKNAHGMLVQIDTAANNPLGVTATSLPGVTFDGLHFTNIRGSAIYSFHSGTIARNCEFDTAAIALWIRGDAGYPAQGWEFSYNHVHNLDKLYQDNRMGTEGEDVGASALVLYRAAGIGGKAFGNLIHTNRVYSSQFTYDGSALEIFAGARNFELYDNKCYDNEIWLETGTQNNEVVDGGNIHHNLVYGPINGNGAGPGFLWRVGANSSIHHNTFVYDGGGPSGTSSAAMILLQNGSTGSSGSVAGTTFKDNLLLMTDTTHVALNSSTNAYNELPNDGVDYNLAYNPLNAASPSFYQVAGGNYAQNAIASYRSARKWGDHDIWGQDPLLDGNYIPQAGSPAIGAASDGTDIGAFSHVATPPPSTLRRATPTRTASGSRTASSGRVASPTRTQTD